VTAVADEVAAALRAIPGVADARLHADGRAEGAGTVRLTLDPHADEVAVAHAVNAVLRSGFGLAVDADRVQVVEDSVPLRGPSAPYGQPRATSVPAAPPATHVAAPAPVATAAAAPAGAPAGAAGRATPRLSIERLSLTSAGLGVTVEVGLAGRTGPAVGSAEAPASGPSVHRAVAEATARAVELALGGRARLAIEGVEATALAGEQAVVVSVALVTGHGAERLTGASRVREDARHAVVRAVLDAVNRRLEALLG
jgi:hypothetical protein